MNEYFFQKTKIPVIFWTHLVYPLKVASIVVPDRVVAFVESFDIVNGNFLSRKSVRCFDSWYEKLTWKSLAKVIGILSITLPSGAVPPSGVYISNVLWMNFIICSIIQFFLIFIHVSTPMQWLNGYGMRSLLVNDNWNKKWKLLTP